MGPYKNTMFQNIANITIVTVIIIVSSMYGISALFPNILGG
jgi:hypothetical protein